jgi:hypothetical protein
VKYSFFVIFLIPVLFAVNGHIIIAQLPNNVQTDDFDHISTLIRSIIPALAEGHPEFLFINNESRTIIYGLADYWDDPREKSNYITSRNSISNLGVSTTNTDNYTWSWIFGNEMDVKPGERYDLITHMKMNEYAQESFVALEGYNETSETWDALMTRCPEEFGWNSVSGESAKVRSMITSEEWHSYRCDVKIPNDTTDVRPVLNAGWSSSSKNAATTLFGPIYLTSLSSTLDFRIANVTYSHGDEDLSIVAFDIDTDETLSTSTPHPLFFLFPREAI